MLQFWNDNYVWIIFSAVAILILIKSDAGAKIWTTFGSASTSVPNALKGLESATSIILALILILLHWAIWWRFSDFWVSWWSESGFLLYQFIILTGILVISMSKKKFLLRGGGVVLVVVGVIFITEITRSAYLKTKDADQIIAAVEEIKKTPAAKRVPSSGCILPYNAAMAKVVGDFWRKHLPTQQAEAMILIAERESGFNQFKRDGTTPYRRCPTPGNPSVSDVGVMQINENAWRPTAIKLGPDYNFYDSPIHNLNMALWIFRKEGFRPWRASISPREIPPGNVTSLPTQSVPPSVITILALHGTWSKPIETNGRGFKADPLGNVKFRLNKDDNRVYQDGPNRRVKDIGPQSSINSIEFQGEDGDAPVSFQFKN